MEDITTFDSRIEPELYFADLISPLRSSDTGAEVNTTGGGVLSSGNVDGGRAARYHYV